MATEYRAKLAFVALASMALGSAVTFGFDKLNTPKPIIITDAVAAAPQLLAPLTTKTTLSDDGSTDGNTTGERTLGKSEGRGEPSRSHKKMTSGVIHINTASLDELEELPGVGPSTAQSIIDFRTQSGGFKSVDELGDIPRMGAKKLKRLMPFVEL